MWNGGDVLDRLDRHANGFERRNRVLTTATGAVNTHIKVLDAELSSFLGGLLSGTSSGKRRTLTRAFETARTGARPNRDY